MKIIVDGEKLDFPEDLTFREMNLAERITGKTAGEMYPALMKGSTDVVFVFAMIAMRRAGKPISEEEMFDWQIDKVDLDLEDNEEGDAEGPPAKPVTPLGPVAPAVVAVEPEADTA